MTSAADYPKAGRAWWLIAILFFASIASVIDRGILNIVVDPLKADLGLSDVQLSLLQGLAFGLFYATVGIPLGLTADRYSRRNLIIGGITIWSLATIGGGLAQGFGSLFASRLLVGLGEAALSPAAISLIADLFPPDKRGRPISVFMTGQALASGLSISVTSFILSEATAGKFAGVPLLGLLEAWRIAFVCCGAMGLFIAAAMLTTAEPRRHIQATTHNFARQARESLGYLVRNGAIFLPLYLGFATCFLAAYGAGAWAPTMLIRTFGAKAADIGRWLGPITIGFAMVGPLIGGFLVDRQARRGQPLAKFYVLGLAPLCAIPSALAVFAPGLHPAIVLIASSSLLMAIVGTTLLAALQAMVPPGMRGVAVSLTGLTNTIVGATTGPLLVALLTEHVFGDPAKVGLSIASVGVPALVVSALLFALAGLALRRQFRDGGEVAEVMRKLTVPPR